MILSLGLFYQLDIGLGDVDLPDIEDLDLWLWTCLNKIDLYYNQSCLYYCYYWLPLFLIVFLFHNYYLFHKKFDPVCMPEVVSLCFHLHSWLANFLLKLIQKTIIINKFTKKLIIVTMELILDCTTWNMLRVVSLYVSVLLCAVVILFSVVNLQSSVVFFEEENWHTICT